MGIWCKFLWYCFARNLLKIIEKSIEKQMNKNRFLKDFKSRFLKDFYTKCIPLLLLIVASSCAKKQDKVELLLSQMTLEEKCGQLTSPIGFNYYGKDDDSLWLADDFLGMMDTLPLGSCWAVLRADPWSRKTVETGLHPRESARLLNMMQRHAIENTRLGIPLLFCEETPHGHMAVGTTVFPTGIGQASTWNPELLEQMGEVMGKEVRLQGAQIGYGPVLDIARDPRWSRVEETMGEDPYLAGTLGAAIVRGMQKNVCATLKHLAAYGIPQGGHNAATADVGPNRLMTDYLPAFEKAICEGGAKTVTTPLMVCLAQQINGCCKTFFAIHGTSKVWFSPI